MKYFLIGVLSSAVMLYGMSLVFGLSDSTSSSRSTGTPPATTPGLFCGGGLPPLIGFAFKVSAVPFHFWAPDTYEGAPTPVTAFLSVASKAGGFVALLTSSSWASSRPARMPGGPPLGARRGCR